MVVKLRAQGLKVPTILGIIAKDATQYFLVIFTAHLVLAATLFFGRVSVTIPLSGLPLMTSDACHRRKRFGFSQLRKLSQKFPEHDHSHSYRHHDQWSSCVSLCSTRASNLPTVSFRYLPVMVSRIMISLRKAADPQRGDWSLVDPAANGVSLRSMRFARPQTSTTEGRDNASLGTSLGV